ncbi:MAG TPA: MmgE/PrpD family protein [Actinophytocola sp.]|uniref:MmgE/PrpD family protein n=1 Tax=Actinophytocola sp. TaxID=1872138 RepID=UPI002DBC2304|nr:MmgE/PrpD family protein [Actinophytocola sp.]HEU5473329.1 MmgE/PrpD family protein [Actinophytocola sp.]
MSESAVDSDRRPRFDGIVTRSASEQLADHVHGLSFDDLPGPVVDKTKELLLHHVGLALRCGGDPLGRQAVQVAHSLSGSNTDCTVIGQPRGASLLDAVFANAVLMSCRGLDDFQLPPAVHQGVVTYPIGLALGEHGHTSGRELITAVVTGYDTQAKLARTMFSWQLPVPRHQYSLFAAFSAAAVAARLLKLSREQTAHALAHAAHLGAGLAEAGDMMGPLQPLVARNGAMAAFLAQAGIPMARTSIEGEHGLFRTVAGHVPGTLAESLSTLGQDFEITRASPKRYGGSGLNIVPQELTLELLKTNALTADDITRVDITLPSEREQRETLMQTRLDQGFRPLWSARFLVASVIACGAIDPLRYPRRGDTYLERALEKVHLHFEPGRPIRYARIEITATTTRRHVAEGDDHVFPPVDAYTWLAEGGTLSDSQIHKLVKLIATLEDVADVAEITTCLTPASAPR